MAATDKLNVRATFEDGSNTTFSIPNYKADSATKANFQTLANAAADVLETDDGSAFANISKATHVVSSETVLNDIAELPIAPNN